MEDLEGFGLRTSGFGPTDTPSGLRPPASGVGVSPSVANVAPVTVAMDDPTALALAIERVAGEGLGATSIVPLLRPDHLPPSPTPSPTPTPSPSPTPTPDPDPDPESESDPGPTPTAHARAPRARGPKPDARSP